MLTTQGPMTPLDRQDYEELTDTGRNPECPGHDDPGMQDAYLPIIYCSRAENCPVGQLPGRDPECPGHDNEDNTGLLYCSRTEGCFEMYD